MARKKTKKKKAAKKKKVAKKAKKKAAKKKKVAKKTSAGWVELQYAKGSSRKFWAIKRSGSKHTVRFGRTGTAGQTKTKEFDSPAEAKASWQKLIDSKKKKGYAEVASSGKKAAKKKTKKKAAKRKVAKKTKKKKAAKKKGGDGSGWDRYELRDAKSQKFWEVRASGKSYSVRYGRIGTKGQEKTKKFESVAKAEAAVTKLVVQKVRKGYRSVEADAYEFDFEQHQAEMAAIFTPEVQAQMHQHFEAQRSADDDRLAESQAAASKSSLLSAPVGKTSCKIDKKRLLGSVSQCSDVFYVPEDCEDPAGEWIHNILSRHTRALACGALVRGNVAVNHKHNAQETSRCKSLAKRAAKFLKGVEPIGSEGGGAYEGFFVVADQNRKAPKRITEKLVRKTLFGDTIDEYAGVRVKSFDEFRENNLQHYYGDGEDFESHPRMKQWDGLYAWFKSEPAFGQLGVIEVSDVRWDAPRRNAGCIFPQALVGLTKSGSVVGVITAKVST